MRTVYGRRGMVHIGEGVRGWLARAGELETGEPEPVLTNAARTEDGARWCLWFDNEPGDAGGRFEKETTEGTDMNIAPVCVARWRAERARHADRWCDGRRTTGCMISAEGCEVEGEGVASAPCRGSGGRCGQEGRSSQCLCVHTTRARPMAYILDNPTTSPATSAHRGHATTRLKVCPPLPRRAACVERA